jgi:hypothetical protein
LSQTYGSLPADSNPTQTINLGQYNPITTAGWFATYAKDFYTKAGGNLKLWNPSLQYILQAQDLTIPAYGQIGGQVQGPVELQQIADQKKVATYLIRNPIETYNQEKAIGYGQQSPNDPNYFVPYWTLEADQPHILAAIRGGESWKAIISNLTEYGYPDDVIADIICLLCADYFTAIEGDGNYWHMANAVGFPYGFQIREPTFGINPYTDEQQTAIAAKDLNWIPSPRGTLSFTSTTWANHVGGELVNLCFPFSDDATENVASMIHLAFLTYFDNQRGAILYGIKDNFDKTISVNIPDVRSRLLAYCQQAEKQYAIPYTFGDLISPTPVTPDMKKYLSQSKYYNPNGLHPPTFGDSMVCTILAGNMPWISNGGVPATYENLKSYYGLVQGFLSLVIKDWAHRTHLWQASSKLPLIPEISLLKPFADLYDT